MSHKKQIALILDEFTFRIKDVLEFENWSFNTDIDFADYSSVMVLGKPNVKNNDFVICKRGNDVVFTGLCKDFVSKTDVGYEIKLAQKECLFDRDVFVVDEDLLETGLEDFVENTISENWLSSGDPLLDNPNITITCTTHTPCAAKVSGLVDTQNGIYNLKTYLGNVRQKYGLFLDFDFTDGALEITISTPEIAPVQMDLTVSDVSELKETYDVTALAKLHVRWKIPDENQSGLIIEGAVEDRTYYFKANRNITTNVNDPDRIGGIVKSVYIETDSEDDMEQQVINEFSGNQYKHSIEFHLNMNSVIYPVSEMFVGRSCIFKTQNGIEETMITAMAMGAEATAAELRFGNLKTTLTAKLREIMK